ncbi:MAG TPA: NTP transferase domain-containing protein [Phenylobacterium sp.]|nr:NTP transferase domain-containing protein [Phenylobacterium sp.]
MLGAIILTGGASSRMGADKAGLDWNGRRAVDRLSDLARQLGGVEVVTAGARAYGLPFAAEEPPGGGPAAGVVAAAALLRGQGCERALVLAVDAPTITQADVAKLLEAPSPGACFEGLQMPLVVDLAALPPAAAHGWSMVKLIETAGLPRLPCPASGRARLRGANTPNERAELLAALIATEAAQKGGAG